MNPLQPIYTETAQCQDCYKCLRQCPVKAIVIQNGHANVIPDRCILCGHCVQVCPRGAKRVRCDLERAKLLFKRKKRVFISIAPSYLAEYPRLKTGQMTNALKALGFEQVSETALGAEQISAAVAGVMPHVKSVMISSACPSVVELVRRYYPQYQADLCQMLSPALAHCRLLRQTYGSDIGIVFVGPCIAKKAESDRHPELMDVAITFEELTDWFRQEGIEPTLAPSDQTDGFVPESARDGKLYPIDGGMIAGIVKDNDMKDSQFMAFSGIEAIQSALAEPEALKNSGPLFLELLACEGGCINGPHIQRHGATAVKRCKAINAVGKLPEKNLTTLQVDVEDSWQIPCLQQVEYTDEQLREALKRVGKFGAEDELNCGGCGYDSCREFAHALLDERAERTMCMGYMRQLAQKQADALLRAMPSGVVIVDEHLAIIESNRRFAELLGNEVERVYEARPHLEGASLSKIVSFDGMFRQVLESGAAHLEKDVRTGSAILRVTVFTIEKNRRVGGIVQDITAPAVRKEQIVNKARKVISKNLQTVQQIAYLLGENAAESEVILNSIVDMFEPATLQEVCNENG